MGCGASAQQGQPRQLVLLGCGECGKTTIFKQIQLLHGTGFSDTAADWVPAIHRSPMRSMRVLIARLREREDNEYKAELEAMSADDKVSWRP